MESSKSRTWAHVDLDSALVRIDVRRFQGKLAVVGNNMRFKLHREGLGYPVNPAYVVADVLALLSQAIHTNDLIFNLHADERREQDPFWRNQYTFVVLPLIRTIIDDLFAITTLISNPSRYGPLFRRAGHWKLQNRITKEREHYGQDPAWAEFLTRKEGMLRLVMSDSGIDQSTLSKKDKWPTLSEYIRPQKGQQLSPQQEFLSRFTYGFWGEYSSISHGGFKGLMDVAGYFTEDMQDVITRKLIPQTYLREMSLHTLRASLLVLCIVTELQVKCTFHDPALDRNIQHTWLELLETYEGRELWEARYQKLISTSGMVKLSNVK